MKRTINALRDWIGAQIFGQVVMRVLSPQAAYRLDKVIEYGATVRPWDHSPTLPSIFKDMPEWRAELQNGYDLSWEPVQEDEDGGWSNRAVAEERIKHWRSDFPFKVGARIRTRTVTAATTVREEHRDD
ncbi:MAG: hypothetical protein ACTH2Y_09170 [Corynebacterium sp.]|uniref:hypothetical protein n=1 Tax=unclassified Corynebacterium TaxID=2624378 RepID=UPI003F8FBEEE